MAQKEELQHRITSAINGQVAIMSQMNLSRGQITDGYHSFDELYEHRAILYMVLIRMIARAHACGIMTKVKTWKSVYHSDGSAFGGWFLAGITLADGRQISYHLPIGYWEKVAAQELEKAPKFDGHTPDDVLDRLLEL